VAIDLILDVALVTLGLLALGGFPVLLGRQNRVLIRMADSYFAVAERAPRLLPRPWRPASTSHGLIPFVRILSWVARVGAFGLALSGTMMLLVGVDALE
jgi:hypothetical protein